MHLLLYEPQRDLFNERIALDDSLALKCIVTYMCPVLHNLQITHIPSS